MNQSIQFTLTRLAIRLSLFILSPLMVEAQDKPSDSLLPVVNLKNAIDYALLNQPRIQQSLLDQEIVETTIKNKLSEWFPQINFNYNLQRNIIIQTTVIGGNPVKLGTDNISVAQFTFSQNIFNRDVLLASRSKDDVRLQAQQFTSSNKIELAAQVSKAFYDVLSTMQQINVSGANIIRLERSLKDAFSQYKAGVADKIDYKRATIALNNSRALKRSNEELLVARREYLRFLMGYPEGALFEIAYDSLQMEREIILDTTLRANFNGRIEYLQLQTQQRLLQYQLKYNKRGYLPEVSFNGAYNFNFQNNAFGQLYTNNFPNSYVALTLGVPLFQGGKRKAEIRAAELELQRNSLDMVNFQHTVNAEYAQTLAVYKSNLQNYLALKENIELAREVYDVVQLQYRSGIKTYLEVITSETDLRSTEINYYNAMYQLLASKIDVQKALGQINY